jgi:hypothetical protein
MIWGSLFHDLVGSGTPYYKDSGLTIRVTYTYLVTAFQDFNSNGVFDAGIDKEGAASNSASATAG